MSIPRRHTLLTLGIVLGLAGSSGLGWADQVVLHHFKGGIAGETPFSGLALGPAGELYGTTSEGGQSGNGAVFKLVPPADGQTTWRLMVIHHLTAITGAKPYGDVLVDPDGAVVITTATGGQHGAGTVVRLTPSKSKNGPVSIRVLHAFTGGADGGSPKSGVVRAADGALYGTTEVGDGTRGVVYQLRPPTRLGADWSFRVLHTFSGGEDGGFPRGNPVLRADGAILTVTSGQSPGGGSVVKVMPPTAVGKPWTTEVVGRFGATPSSYIRAGLTIDDHGRLHGATSGDGPGEGAVFRINPPTAKGGPWRTEILHGFTPDDLLGTEPMMAGPITYAPGKLVGATLTGGPGDKGTVYMLTRRSDGWKGTILHAFHGFGSGNGLKSRLVRNADGVLFGTTAGGGKFHYGTVYAVTP